MIKIVSRKVLLALILGFVCSISFASCNDDDDDYVDSSKLIGSWSYNGKKDITVEISGASADMKDIVEKHIRNSYQPFLNEGDTYILKEEGSLDIRRNGSTWRGSLVYNYSKSNGSFKVYKNSEKESHLTYKVVSITDNDAILKYTYDIDEMHWQGIEITGIKITSATALIHLKRTNTK